MSIDQPADQPAVSVADMPQGDTASEQVSGREQLSTDQRKAIGHEIIDQVGIASPDRQAGEPVQERGFSETLLEGGKTSLKKAGENLIAVEVNLSIADLSTQNLLPIAPANKPLTDDEIVERFEKYGVVKAVATFEQQLGQEATRQNTFRYAGPRAQRLFNRGVSAPNTMTEADGLKELDGFLATYLENSAKHKRKERLVNLAHGIRENLTFIGEQEYLEAANGMSKVLQSYLDQDDANKICLLTEIGQLKRYRGQKTRKSDVELRDEIFATLNDEQLERYSGRIVTSMNNFEVDPEHSKVILLDDRSFSGKQLRDEYDMLMKNPNFVRYVEAGSVEVHLMVGSEQQIRDGFLPDSYGDFRLPLKAYFISHNSEASLYDHAGHVTSVRSVGNHDYGRPVEQMAKEEKTTMPALARIASQSKHTIPEVVMKGGQLIRLRPDGRVHGE